ncbi:MAG: heme lyase CcmF/NrfE family subunit [Anaerolineae bacterium]|nr:heme lyase CcmF/NrfE family subunit [Anaerolineae bacterium]
MILPEIGYGALLLALAAALWATIASILGAWQRRPELVTSARNALFVTAGLSTLAVIVLLALLLTKNFGVAYVNDHVSTYLRPAYVLAAFWAGMEGSQLLWLWLLAIFTALLVLRQPTWDRQLRPYAMAVLAFTQVFFALLLVVLSNPFELLPFLPAEGISLNPLLQNFWMIIHPPIVFAAYALWTIPFAYGLAALATGKLDAGWLLGVRRWSLAAWATLGIGILIGALWAYLELGWGGYWAWDPVESSSFIPWLAGTAFLHSAIIQERRDMFRAWSVGLAVLTFLLTVFATFVTRSGLIESVHAFAQSPIGYYYLVFMGLILAAAAGLMLARTRELKGSGQLGDLVSREFAFLVTNLLFLGSAGAILLGTLWPTFTEAVRGVATTLTPENYNRFMGPLGLLLVVLLGLCPLIEWRKISAGRLLRSIWIQAAVGAVTAALLLLFGVREVWVVAAFAVVAFAAATIAIQWAADIVARMRPKRVPERQRSGRATEQNLLVATGRAIRASSGRRRRYGGQLIHLAILLTVAGIIGSHAYQDEVQVVLAKGEQTEVGSYTLLYKSYTYRQLEENGNKLRNAALVEVYRNGRRLAVMEPERNLHSNVNGSVTEVALRTNLKEDLYLILASLEQDGLAAFQVIVTPMVLWLWLGGLLLIAGTLVAAWPAASRPATVTVPAGRESASQQAVRR